MSIIPNSWLLRLLWKVRIFQRILKKSGSALLFLIRIVFVRTPFLGGASTYEAFGKGQMLTAYLKSNDKLREVRARPLAVSKRRLGF